MLVSTFEILVKSQLPPELKSPLSRKVIQGYFLTLSNLNPFSVVLSLVFTAVTPSLNDVIPLLDVTGVNVGGPLVPDPIPPKVRFQLRLPANDTGLFLLQPDIIKKPELLTDEKQSLEVRGFVEIFVSSLSGRNSADILVTPEQRGTFFGDLKAADPRLDQIAYSIPTAHGGSLFTLSNS
ncbi:hypothetical protein [Nostoc sp. FACHB-888]|uniref:hypothetical protein n=1 Tax=Nostoc sp. FACHB-888 TaxID=2692842 RepID=UPI001681FC1E|nr:hypothetical protein [Nostoc sp. FACHB-888]MBD2246329.1 hypothetical protein [Nostoc sp. FACHB-888]